MEINFEKYDNQTTAEYVIAQLIEQLDLSTQTPIFKLEQQVLYTLGIITILYKEYLYNEELIKITKKTNDPLDYKPMNEQISDIIIKLKKSLEKKDIIETLSIIMFHGEIIQDLLKRYFARSNQNYILKKTPIKIIQQNKKTKEMLELNPYVINQILKYEQDPMTDEEQTISDIIDYYTIGAINDIKNQGKRIKYIKQLLMLNHDKEKLNKAIIFIVGNIYQEVIDRKIVELYNEMQSIIENLSNTNEQIVKYFVESDNFSNKMLTLFLNLNSKIKEDRLNELKQKPTYQYIKRRNEK